METGEGKSPLSSAEISGDGLDKVDAPNDWVEPTSPIKADANELEEGFQRLDPSHVTAERISGAIGSAVLTAVGFTAIVITAFAIGERWIWLTVVGGVCALLLTIWFFSLYWPALHHRYASWRLNELGLEIRKGVLWRHRITVPRARVQHVDVSQGPLQRNFGLAQLSVHTAGTENSTVELVGLKHSVALGVRDELVSKKDSVHVV